MGQTNSNPVRLYTRFIRILKIIQYLGFFVVVLLGLMYLGFAGGMSPQGPLAPLALVVFLLQASIGCGMIYVVTQALIAIVDLLSRIEQNTRPQ
jgi:4-hydroxybenzoate polyprenyltransferase